MEISATQLKVGVKYKIASARKGFSEGVDSQLLDPINKPHLLRELMPCLCGLALYRHSIPFALRQGFPRSCCVKLSRDALLRPSNVFNLSATGWAA